MKLVHTCALSLGYNQDTITSAKATRNTKGSCLEQTDTAIMAINSGQELTVLKHALCSTMTMMYSLGENDDGLRPLDSFVAVIALLENCEDADGVVCHPRFQLTPQNLVLANRTIVYNNVALGWYEQGHLKQALWSLQNTLTALRQFHSDGGKEPVSNNTVSTLLSNMGHIFFQIGDLVKALNLSVEAYRSHNGTEDEFRASLLFNFGCLLFILDQSLAEAESAFTCSLQIISNSDSEMRDRDVVTVQSLLLII